MSLAVVAMFFTFVFPIPIVMVVCGMLQNVLLMTLAAFFAYSVVRGRRLNNAEEANNDA